MKNLRRLVASLALVVTMGFTPRAALAQSSGKVAPKGARKILRVEELKFESKIPKPQAMFLMPRANLNYGDLDRAEPFLSKVTKAVEKDPF